ncbi:MAG: hypothetical protein Q4Q03_07910 [Bowdeniella nasicola]|nr:hypothetical protein [Bowdeniella nasicola]
MSNLATTSTSDTRRPAYGMGRILILIYGIFALAATARSLVQLIRNAEEAPLAYGLSAFAAVVYIVATICLAHNGRRMRKVAFTAVLIEAIGVISVGIISYTNPELFPRATVWSHFGSGYGFVPLVLPFLGLAWLYSSNPARLTQN